MRNILEHLHYVADAASILTAAVAVIASLYYWWTRREKRKKLEDYLKAESIKNPNRRTHTILHLMAKLGLTKAEILTASFSSKHIIRKEHVDRDTGLTDGILFEYREESKAK